MTTTEDSSSYKGGCDCDQSRYQLVGKALCVHCCHCRWCQRESGSAFVLNAMYETGRVQLSTAVVLEENDLPTESGKAQRVSCCPACKVVLRSRPKWNGDYWRVVRVGTLDNPDLFPPDVHAFTTSKQPLMKLGDGGLQFNGFYKSREWWKRDKLERFGKMVEKIKRKRKGGERGKL